MKKITEPLLFLSDVLHAAHERLRDQQLPQWLDSEIQNRLVLALNHVLKQNPQAQERLREQKNKVVQVLWQNRTMTLQISAAGLFMLADASARQDLVLRIEEERPWKLAQQTMQGQQPAVHISGDAQLAGAVNWLVAHVRWSAEADLQRLLGAHATQQINAVFRQLRTALQGFVQTATSKAQGFAHTQDGNSHANNHAPKQSGF